MEIQTAKYRGLLALSPLLVFLGVYLASSLIAHDFYRIPVSVAFLIASIYGRAVYLIQSTALGLV